MSTPGPNPHPAPLLRRRRGPDTAPGPDGENGRGRAGALLRGWRERRRRSQLELSIAAEVSTRHLSWLETGRSQPSRAMIARLCDELDVPLRERNVIYLAGGFAPIHHESPLQDLGAARRAVEAVLAGHEPYPAVAVDAHWDLLAANRAMSTFLSGLPRQLSEPRPNMLRLTLHPDGLATQLINHSQWRTLTLRRVRRQYERTADPVLGELFDELESYPPPADAGEEPADAHGDLATPMLLETEFGRLSLTYAVTVFGSPRDVTLDEIAIETFLPADDATRDLMDQLAHSTRSRSAQG